MTPNIAIVHIQRPYSRGFRLWVPLFLLWIPVLLLSPFIFLVLLAGCIAGKISVWRALAVFWDIVCSLPGTHVHVSAHGTQILVRVL
ncbi:MAG: hypothetical protein ABSE51_11320 [Terracidiphilus sp.]